jgi:hypothetical protein
MHVSSYKESWIAFSSTIKRGEDHGKETPSLSSNTNTYLYKYLAIFKAFFQELVEVVYKYFQGG